MKNLSVLIPTFNDGCVELVTTLYQQAEALGIGYEILVADDGSTDKAVVEENRQINGLSNCRLIEQPVNQGRAAIRNFLARQAKYPWLVFIDSDMVVCSEDYVRRYAETAGSSVVDGGVVIGQVIQGNLRSLYEKAAEQEHTFEKRQLSPYQDFHTANFMIERELMLQHPFDERFRYYGYEDVLFGKAMQQAGIPITHIDNPLSFEVFEDNAAFIAKTEEGLRTLYTFREELKDYSRLLITMSRLPQGPIHLWHKLFGKLEKQNLVGRHPSLLVFNLYKIGYLSHLLHGNISAGHINL